MRRRPAVRIRLWPANANHCASPADFGSVLPSPIPAGREVWRQAPNRTLAPTMSLRTGRWDGACECTSPAGRSDPYAGRYPPDR